MPLRTCGRLLCALVVLVVLSGTASASGVATSYGVADTLDTTVSIDDTLDTNTTVNATVTTVENTTVSGAVDANDSETMVSAGTSANGSDTSGSIDATVNSSGVSVDGDATTNNTPVVEADVGTTVSTTSPSTDDGPTDGSPASTPQTNREAALGDDSTPSSGPASGPVNGGDGGSGPGAPTRTAALGAVAIAGGAAATRRGLSVASTGSPLLPAVQDAVATTVQWLRTNLPRIIVPLRYSRRDDSDPLEHDVRADLYDAIQTTPGVHQSGFEATVDVSLSSVRYHLRILEEESLIESERIRGKRRYFPANAADTELVSALGESATASVLRTLADVEPATGGELAQRLGRDPSTISHHLSRLEADGLVEREREGQSVVTCLADDVRQVIAAEEPVEATTVAD